jgi:hypothetical protein
MNAVRFEFSVSKPNAATQIIYFHVTCDLYANNIEIRTELQIRKELSAFIECFTPSQNDIHILRKSKILTLSQS